MNKVGIIVFSANLKLKSLNGINSKAKVWKKTVILTPHRLFQNEKDYINNLYKKTEYVDYGELLTDSEAEECDLVAYEKNKNSLSKYYELIDCEKNKKIIDKIKKRYGKFEGYILSGDLGIVKEIWEENGFKYLRGDYYISMPDNYEKDLGSKEKNFTKDVFVYETDNKKYVFIGGVKRVSDKMSIDLVYSEEERNRLINREFELKEDCQYITTVHEYYKCNIPNSDEYDVRILGDGFFPSNWTSKDLLYYRDKYTFYAFDNLMKKGLEIYGRNVSIFPFRKKQYMLNPSFENKVRCILVALQCGGPWTALVNRSDTDMLVETIVSIAKEYPSIEFICRCHPLSIIKTHDGPNAINRIGKYIESTNIKNLHMSTNGIQSLEDLSFENRSLEEDLTKADLVISEFSNTLLDAALKGKIIASINVTNRRNFFQSVTELGFPHCESIEDLKHIIDNYNNLEYRKRYHQAVVNYNKMIDSEAI